MDESFMSIGSFDEENFLSEAFPETTDSQNQLNSSNDMSTSSIDIKSLLSQPFKEPEPKTRLVFADTETPKSNGRGGHRKRKNNTRRCLSTDLNDSSLSFEDDLQSFDTSRQSKEPRNEAQFSASKILVSLKKPNILSSIENTLSPKRNEHKLNNSKIELTPEFNSQNDTKKNDENKVVSLIPSRQSKGGSLFQKSYSENHASIMQALQLSSSNPALIGDFSKPYVLPFLSSCKHQDLKSISSHVLASLIKGQYKHCVESFTVIDCRYPYEFEGGHIQDAVNLYTQELILSKLLPNKSVTAKTNDSLSKRSILIFHCEFSSERGPGLCRFLRNRDRVQNNQTYPCLNYPEMYLLEGGYKDFYTHYSTLCQPMSYLPMHAKEHENELRKFRSIVKSHSFDTKFTTHKRNTFRH
ncbi:M-phase inducer phosphatase 1 [Tyrophagus putrescentiae]|nr:M-phase inducer phosphatase 1 [Tyrophagus putrescentiae]